MGSGRLLPTHYVQRSDNSSLLLLGIDATLLPRAIVLTVTLTAPTDPSQTRRIIGIIILERQDHLQDPIQSSSNF